MGQPTASGLACLVCVGLVGSGLAASGECPPWVLWVSGGGLGLSGGLVVVSLFLRARAAELTAKDRALAEALAGRKQAEQALRSREERYTLTTTAGQVGLWDWNLDTNEIYLDPNLKAMIGYQDHEIRNHPDDWGRHVHPDDADEVMAEAKAHLEGLKPHYEVSHRMLHKDGSVRWFLARGTAIRRPDGRPYRVVGTDTDITERRHAEEALRASLQEKDLLLKEVHHRVKNNLQIISSLLSLQAARVRDQAVLEVFEHSQARIRAMALIHERLYQSGGFSRIDFAEYVSALTGAMFVSAAVAPDLVRLKADVTSAPLSIEKAIPCGLILNELVSNCLKHAFPGGRRGLIHVRLTEDAPGQMLMVVADDGTGLPEGLDFRNTESLGLQLVNTLVRQIHGAIRVETGRGTRFEIRFPGDDSPNEGNRHAGNANPGR